MKMRMKVKEREKKSSKVNQQIKRKKMNGNEVTEKK